MKKELNYPITLNVKLDWNTDMLLSELQEILGKSRTQLTRLILIDFFNRNNDLLDEYFDKKISKEELNKIFLHNISDESKLDINNYFKHKSQNAEA